MTGASEQSRIQEEVVPTSDDEEALEDQVVQILKNEGMDGWRRYMEDAVKQSDAFGFSSSARFNDLEATISKAQDVNPLASWESSTKAQDTVVVHRAGDSMRKVVDVPVTASRLQHSPTASPEHPLESGSIDPLSPKQNSTGLPVPREATSPASTVRPPSPPERRDRKRSSTSSLSSLSSLDGLAPRPQVLANDKSSSPQSSQRQSYGIEKDSVQSPHVDAPTETPSVTPNAAIALEPEPILDPTLLEFQNARTFRRRTAIQLAPYTREKTKYTAMVKKGGKRLIAELLHDDPDKAVLAKKIMEEQDEADAATYEEEEPEGEDQDIDMSISPIVSPTDQDYDDYFELYGQVAEDSVDSKLQTLARTRLKKAEKERRQKERAEKEARKYMAMIERQVKERDRARKAAEKEERKRLRELKEKEKHDKRLSHEMGQKKRPLPDKGPKKRKSDASPLVEDENVS